MPDITQTCRITNKDFVVTEWEQGILKEFGLALPTLCIDERHRRRMSRRNERRIYNSVCDKTGKAIISMYPKDSEFTVYSQEAWWSDDWDAKDYGKEYDFSRPFFQQFAELQKIVPRMSVMNKHAENSDYCNLTTNNKNCYLVFGGDFNEDCMYSIINMKCRDVSDVYWVWESELMYDSTDCEKCYNVKYCQNAANCVDSSFLYECRNCTNCFGCVGLNGKEYQIFNEQYTPEDYARKIQEFRLETWSGVQHMKKEFKKFHLRFPHRATRILNSENATGDIISDAKNCTNCFAVSGPAEDIKDIFIVAAPLNNAFSCNHVGFKAELFYEMMGSIEGYHSALCSFSWASNNTYYCDMVDSSHDLFGCVSMYRGQYCILNKQYTKEEYEELLPIIIEHMKSTGEWGEFFPMEISPFAYNETVANDYYKLTREGALALGLKWKDEDLHIGAGPKLPDSINDVEDEVLQMNLICEKTGRAYKIIPQELKLYRQMGIPIPRYAPETRNEDRILKRNPWQLWDRNCAKCNVTISTSYSPERPEIIYCENCYLKEVY